MIERYSRKEMAQIWHVEKRFEYMLKVELAVAASQAQLALIPTKANQEIQKKAKFEYQRILEIEQITRHDVIAFVSAVAENIGEAGKYLHYGMTSSDILDTALSLQVRDASVLILKQIDKLSMQLKKQIRKHSKTICAGRTHGIHAEPISFGYKLCGFYQEIFRNRKRLETAFKQFEICKLSGAVGTYANQMQLVEKKVARKLSLKIEDLATQIIPRDRHAEVLNAIAMMGCALERLALEFRHLQRTEVSEVYESFAKSQKGSSAMPHKKNPISAENICGQARLLRSYAHIGLENIALWHERDISHSATERVSFVDAFILLDYCLQRTSDLVERLEVDKERMLVNMDLSNGNLYSSQVLLLMLKKTKTREQAYSIVQSLSHTIKPGEHLKNKLLSSKEAMQYLTKKEVENIFNSTELKKNMQNKIQQILSKK